MSALIYARSVPAVLFHPNLKAGLGSPAAPVAYDSLSSLEKIIIWRCTGRSACSAHRAHDANNLYIVGFNEQYIFISTFGRPEMATFFGLLRRGFPRPCFELIFFDLAGKTGM